MKTRDYISAIAIERLLEDSTLPADIRMQAEQVLAEIDRDVAKVQVQQYWEDYTGETEEAIERWKFSRDEE